MRPIARLSAGLVAVTGLLLAAGDGAAQEPTLVVPFQGSQAFRSLLLDRACNFQPLQEVADLGKVPPAETLLIVFGDTQVLDRIRDVTGGLARFRERGGAILIASDRPDEGRLKELGAQVSGERLQQAMGGYRDSFYCPILLPDDEGHPLFARLPRRVATNMPSHLGVRKDLVVIGLVFGDRGHSYYVAVSGDDERGGRVVILAGHGVFLNGMLAQADNGNYEFGFNCLRWLRGNGRRPYALFIEEGKVQTSFQVPLAQLPPLPVPPMRVLDEALRGMEDENWFNQLLLENVSKESIVRVVLFVGSILLALFLLRRLFSARHNIDAWQPLLAQKVEQALAALPALAQRRDELLQTGNYWETAHAVAREALASAGVDATGQGPPRVHAVGGWWQRWRWGRRVRRLWDLAHGPVPVRISQRRLVRLLKNVDYLMAALAAGEVVLAKAGAPATNSEWQRAATVGRPAARMTRGTVAGNS
jgi:hypothetical protein